MPELPDVQVFKEYVDATALHKEITGVGTDDGQVLQVSPRTLRRHLLGRRLASTSRHGKHLFAEIEGDTLMNQSLLAGLGNIYVDEILFQTGLHPAKSVTELDRETITRLHRTMGRVLERAIQAHAQPDEMPRTWLLPHRAEGEKCPRCGAAIQKRQVGGRATYVCPEEQAA